MLLEELEELEELVLGEEQRQLVLVQVQLRQALAQELDEEQRRVREVQSRHRSLWQPLQASKRHHASTGCRRRFSTADCRGQNASCRKRR